MSIRKDSGVIAGFTSLFIASASMADDVLKLEDGFDYSASDLLEIMPGVNQVPVEVSWEDIIAVTIEDPVLKRQVENFLDLLERSEFPYYAGDNLQYLSGQYILKLMDRNLTVYEQSGAKQVLEDAGMMEDGRFIIGSHNRSYDGDPLSGSHTKIATIGGVNLPTTIILGEKYQKGAFQYSEDGSLAPVTVEGVLANELAHLSDIVDGQQGSIQIENLITVHLGATPRGYDKTYAEYAAGVHGGYVSLIDNMFVFEANTPENTPETLKP